MIIRYCRIGAVRCPTGPYIAVPRICSGKTVSHRSVGLVIHHGLRFATYKPTRYLTQHTAPCSSSPYPIHKRIQLTYCPVSPSCVRQWSDFCCLGSNRTLASVNVPGQISWQRGIESLCSINGENRHHRIFCTDHLNPACPIFSAPCGSRLRQCCWPAGSSVVVSRVCCGL